MLKTIMHDKNINLQCIDFFENNPDLISFTISPTADYRLDTKIQVSNFFKDQAQLKTNFFFIEDIDLIPITPFLNKNLESIDSFISFIGRVFTQNFINKNKENLIRFSFAGIENL